MFSFVQRQESNKYTINLNWMQNIEEENATMPLKGCASYIFKTEYIHVLVYGI